jgi:ribonuclease Y
VEFPPFFPAQADGSSNTLLWVIVSAVVAGGLGFLVKWYMDKLVVADARREADKILEEGRKQAETVKQQAEVAAKSEFYKRKEEFDRECTGVRNEMREVERRLEKREDTLDQKLETLSTKERLLDNREKTVAKRETTVTQNEKDSADLLAKHKEELIRISRMGENDARDALMKRLEMEMEQELGTFIQKRTEAAADEAETKAREILTTAIQRYAAGHTAETTTAAVDIPSDEMKGRIIGREGRNIRAFEKATGVDVIVDDTPGVVVVSSFDPIRRQVARITLEKLIQDGRIHPARIEELVSETRKEMEAKINNMGKQAVLEANIQGLHPKLVNYLGRLSFRTSYSQNVLRHSLEVAYICQLMAEEMGLDGQLARRCGLLHDIGKSCDHEMEGGHPAIGADLCKRHGERSEVVNAAAAHHGDIPSTSMYTPLVAAADAVSASRPGARRESLEKYVQRLEELESLVHGFPGVESVYAIQAGREVRVMVDAKKVDDGGAMKMARDIAKAIEDTLTYPGEIKVTLMRETRCVEVAR